MVGRVIALSVFAGAVLLALGRLELAGVDSDARLAMAPVAAAPIAAGSPPAAPPEGGAGSAVPEREDPEALAAWFQQQVLQELQRSSSGVQAVGSIEAKKNRQINWQYVEGVFEGRISGIPNERQAGISLQEMEELGDIPYVQQLRKEKRFDELRDLGFENETVPWPECLRTATCRLDRASSPPR
jgi:hypothetical protein